MAKELGVPFVLKAPTLDELAELGEKCVAADFKEVVLDPMSANLQDALRDQTYIRRAAIKKKFRPLGFPTIAFPCQHDRRPDAEDGLRRRSSWRSTRASSSSTPSTRRRCCRC